MTGSVVLARHLAVLSDPTVLWDWRVRIAGCDVDVEVWSASLDLDAGHAYRRDALICRGALAGDGRVVWHRS